MRPNMARGPLKFGVSRPAIISHLALRGYGRRMSDFIAPFERLWLVGCGNMAGAMLSRWLACGLEPARVTVVRPSGAPVASGVRVLTALPDEPAPDALMLGVKPQMLDAVTASVANAVAEHTVLVSILAGVEAAVLRAHFSQAGAIVRAMPNTPVALGKGVVPLFADNADAGARTRVEALMRPLGLVEWMATEAEFALVTGLTGSGPAFLFRFVDALAAAAADLGVERGQALRLATAMVEGAAVLAAGSDESPAQLADRVASKGGSTRAGLDVLDTNESLRSLVRRTLAAAKRRNEEMAAEARR